MGLTLAVFRTLDIFFAPNIKGEANEIRIVFKSFDFPGDLVYGQFDEIYLRVHFRLFYYNSIRSKTFDKLVAAVSASI